MQLDRDLLSKHSLGVAQGRKYVAHRDDRTYHTIVVDLVRPSIALSIVHRGAQLRQYSYKLLDD